METDNFQYKGEKVLIRWDSKEDIFFVDLWGDHGEKDAKEFMDNFYEVVKKTPRSNPLLFILVDVSKLGKISHEARRVYAQEPAKRLFQSYAAICGPNAIIRLMIGFITTVLRKNVKVFAANEDGAKWLRKMQAKK